MKTILSSLLILISLASFSQKKDMRNGVYSAHLSSVEVSKNVGLGTVDTLLSLYEDSLIRIDWSYAVSEFDFNLKNKSEQTLKIIWDDAAFISVSNESGKIFHKGVKYVDRESSQPPTAVYKNTNLSDLIAPTSYTTYVSGQYGGWRSAPLIPVKTNLWTGKVEYDQLLTGQVMRVVLPIKFEDKTIEYTFFFKTEFIEKKKK